MTTNRICVIESCDRPVYVQIRGLCGAHYHRWQRYGDPEGGGAPRSGTTPIERICAKSRREDRGYITPCRVFTGYRSKKGYGDVGAGKAVHVIIYEYVHGPVPKGEPVHHRCEQPDCWDPLHLIALTPLQHKAEHHRTHCYRGHPLSGENLEFAHRSNGYVDRRCRACRKMRLARKGKT